MNRRGRGGRYRNNRSFSNRKPPNPPPMLGPAPSFDSPQIVGYMSVDRDRTYSSDLSELRFVNRVPQGPVCMDLNHNIHNAVKRTTVDNVERIDLMLQFILDKGVYLDLNEEFTIICYRRSLLEVMCKAWPGLEPSLTAATLLDGCIYLCPIQSPEEVHRRDTWTERDKAMCAWGYKFEQYMTSDAPNKSPTVSEPVIENAEFSLYYSTTFGSHRLFYGAQIDGLIAKEKSPPPPSSGGFEECLQYLRNQSYLELKTNRVISNEYQEENFKRRKLLYCWGQCLLSRLKGVAMGFRDDAGVVNRLTCYDTDQIVRYCEDQWNPAGALSFLNHFLSRVKDHFRRELQQSGSTSSPITALFSIQTDRERTITVSEYECILPEWYIEGRRKQTQDIKSTTSIH